MTRHTTRRPALSLRASGDRWLFGYADVVTLLFACFASLYAAEIAAPRAATPNTDVALARPAAPVVDAVASAPRMPPALAPAVVLDAAPEGVDVQTTERGIVISLPETGTFAPGQADLAADVRAGLRRLADLLGPLPNAIRVEGHTDDRPIRTLAFDSNWDLSVARATRVVRWLIEEGGVAPERLSAAGYAEHRPRVPNDTPEARARNRRVDIVVLDPLAARTEAPVEGVR